MSSDLSANRQNNLRFIHLEFGLVSTIDGLVSKKSSGSDHRGGHTITDEDDGVLGDRLLGQGQDLPFGHSGLSVVVGKGNGILSGFVQLDVPVAFGENVDGGFGTRLLCEKVLVVGEVVRLDYPSAQWNTLGELKR